MLRLHGDNHKQSRLVEVQKTPTFPRKADTLYGQMNFWISTLTTNPSLRFAFWKHLWQAALTDNSYVNNTKRCAPCYYWMQSNGSQLYDFQTISSGNTLPAPRLICKKCVQYHSELDVTAHLTTSISENEKTQIVRNFIRSYPPNRGFKRQPPKTAS